MEVPDTPPKEVHRVKAVYPLIARKNRWRDLVIVRVLVDENGRPIQAKVLRSKYKPLGDAAVKAAMRSTFRPARHQDVPVKSWITLTYQFKP